MAQQEKSMPLTPEARQRLAGAMDARRRELRLRWQDVAKAGGISLKTLHSVRTGSSGIAALTERGIEDGLQWAGGSVRAIAAGGDPAPRSVSPPEGRLPILDDPDEEGLLPYLQGVRDVLAAAVARHGTGFTGAQAFADPREAMWWDTVPMTAPQKERLIARTRRLSAEHGGTSQGRNVS
jgi:hypothetical protein